jgi:glycolate oxidase FAD binding subunit
MGLMASAGSAANSAFAALVGSEDPVCVAGGRTQWFVGGVPAPGTRVVGAPVGVVSHQPAEMIVRVGAGTTVASLSASLAGAGQMVPLAEGGGSTVGAGTTVGGVLAVGHSGIRRLRYGPVRDTVLEVTFVTGAGKLVKAGGPVVKNVTGYDLCRLLVGSLGTLGLVAEVVLRCYPIPAASRWLRSDGGVDPFEVSQRLFRPSAVLWDGTRTWVLLEGHPDDVEAEAAGVLGPAFVEVESGPPVETMGRLGRLGRLSVPPGVLARLPGVGAGVGWGWLAEVGVGVIHTDRPAELAAALELPWPPRLEPRLAELHHALKQRFDPSGRLNPGRSVAVVA